MDEPPGTLSAFRRHDVSETPTLAPEDTDCAVGRQLYHFAQSHKEETMSKSLVLRVFAAGLSVMLGACRYHPTPVLLQGEPADISALAGQWDGEYWSGQSGRSGSITFRVQAGKDTAYGDVLMVPAAGGQPVTAADVESRAHAAHSPLPELLRVTFVRVTGGLVEGELEPYVAPDCKCVVFTVFRGAVQGNEIKGEYVTRGAMGLRREGKWGVKRKPSSGGT